MTTLRILFATLLLAAVVTAQQPFFGRCPDHVPMTDFDLRRFMGVWYETERSFNLLEAAGKCMLTNYTLGDGSKILALNHITNFLTGVTRITEGEVRNAGKLGEAKLSVRYYRLPVPVDFSYTVLNTDYDDYAVLWNCVPVGGPLVNTQTVWIMTRKRNPEAKILQKAYGILDQYKISRTGFAKIDQKDCTQEAVVEDIDEEAQKNVASKSAYPEPSKEMEPPKKDTTMDKIKKEQGEKPVPVPVPLPAVITPSVEPIKEAANQPESSSSSINNEKPTKQ